MAEDRTQLWRRRGIAQAVAAVSVAGAGVVAAMGLPGVQPPEPLNPIVVEQPTVDVEAIPNNDETVAAYDSSLIAGQFAMLGNAPVPPAPEQPSMDEAGEELGNPLLVDNTDFEPGAVEVRYIGRIMVGGSPRAALTIGDTQRLTRIGRVYDGIEPIEIEEQFVIIERDGARTRIDKEGRTMDRVQTVAAPIVNPELISKPGDDGRVMPAGQTRAINAKAGAAAAAASASGAGTNAGAAAADRERRLQSMRERYPERFEAGVEAGDE
jgi:hypothetical protein